LKEIEGVYTGFWWGDLREVDHLEDLGVDIRIILKRLFNSWFGEAWTVFNRIGKCRGDL
jgi:hypothetical protein